MNRNTSTIVGLAILIGAYAFYSRFGFPAYHVYRALALLGGFQHHGF